MSSALDPQVRTSIELARASAEAARRGVANSRDLLAALLAQTGSESLLSVIQGSRGAARESPMGDLPSISGGPRLTAFSQEAKRSIDHAIVEALSHGERVIRPYHLLLGLIHSDSTTAATELRKRGVDLKGLRTAIQAILPEVTPRSTDEQALPAEEADPLSLHEVGILTSMVSLGEDARTALTSDDVSVSRELDKIIEAASHVERKLVELYRPFLVALFRGHPSWSGRDETRMSGVIRSACIAFDAERGFRFSSYLAWFVALEQDHPASPSSQPS